MAYTKENQYESITAADFNAIKNAIKAECDRRQYTNPLKKITLDDVTNTTQITDDLFKTILEPLTVLDAFPGNINDLFIKTNQSETAVTLNDIQNLPIEEISKNKILAIINTVKNWTDPHKNSSSSSDCRGTCAGLCSGCQGTCDTTCKGGCTGSCKGNCTGTCSGSCWKQCNSGCTGSCNSCTSGCKGNCGGPCGGDGCGYGCEWTGGSGGWRCSSK